MNHTEYKRYLKSKHWQETRSAAIAGAGNTCQQCGKKAGKTIWLEVHHLTYERIGEELPEDLRVLCHNCHRKEHGLPPDKIRRRRRKLRRKIVART